MRFDAHKMPPSQRSGKQRQQLRMLSSALRRQPQQLWLKNEMLSIGSVWPLKPHELQLRKLRPITRGQPMPHVPHKKPQSGSVTPSPPLLRKLRGERRAPQERRGLSLSKIVSRRVAGMRESLTERLHSAHPLCQQMFRRIARALLVRGAVQMHAWLTRLVSIRIAQLVSPLARTTRRHPLMLMLRRVARVELPRRQSEMTPTSHLGAEIKVVIIICESLLLVRREQCRSRALSCQSKCTC